MNRILSLLSVFLLFASLAEAQDNQLIKQKINDIKTKSDIYYWYQYAHPDAETAKANATKYLINEMNYGLEEKKYHEDTIIPYLKYVNINRGQSIQYLVYIKKKDADDLVNGLTPTQENEAAHYPTHSDDASLETSTSSVTPSITTQSPSVSARFVPDAFVQRIMETENFIDVYKLLKYMKSQGEILQLGKLKEIEDYRSLDLILFDMQSQKIISMLSSATESGTRTNLVNGTMDSLDNYPTSMTAVIWYIKK